MPDALPFRRRDLSRALTRIGAASVRETLAGPIDATPGKAARIGITGAPGSGKSTLIARLAARRIGARDSIGILAIDPSSPYSQGSILGDRIRMDDIAGDPRIYIRSMPSHDTHDGLADNIADMLAAMDRFGFDDLILETVGVGQAEYSVRSMVETVILVLIPGSGDAIQAMKAGILETADIYVVNKADLPGAKVAAAEVRAIMSMRPDKDDAWRPPVILTGQGETDGLAALSAAIDEHIAWTRARTDADARRRARTRYHAHNLISRRVAEILGEAPLADFDRPLREIYADLAARLAADD